MDEGERGVRRRAVDLLFRRRLKGIQELSKQNLGDEVFCGPESAQEGDSKIFHIRSVIEERFDSLSADGLAHFNARCGSAVWRQELISCRFDIGRHVLSNKSCSIERFGSTGIVRPAPLQSRSGLSRSVLPAQQSRPVALGPGDASPPRRVACYLRPRKERPARA